MSSYSINRWLHERDGVNSMLDGDARHRARAVAEVDGLRLGLCYLDELHATVSPEARLDDTHAPTGIESIGPRFEFEHHAEAEAVSIWNDQSFYISESFEQSTALSEAESVRRYSTGPTWDPCMMHEDLFTCLGMATEPQEGLPPTPPRTTQSSPQPDMPADCQRDLENTTLPSIKRLPNQEQFEILQQVTHGVGQQFDGLESACGMSTPMSKLRQHYHTANGLRDHGFIVFRDVLDKRAVPRTLVDVFALATVSYVTSTLLLRQGRLKQDEVLVGLQLWRDSISSPDERQAFETVTKNLWPEARAQYDPREHDFQASTFLDTALSMESFDIDHAPVPNPLNPGLHGTRPPETGLDPPDGSVFKSPVNSFAGSSGASSQERIRQRQQTNALNIANNMNGIWGFSNLSTPTENEVIISELLGADFTFSTQPIALGKEHQQSFRQKDVSSPGRIQGAELERTGVFMSVLVFVKDLGSFLYNMSGYQTTTRDVLDVVKQSRFVQELRQGFLTKLQEYGSSKNPFALACSPVIETCATWGALSSLRQVKSFLLDFARVSCLCEHIRPVYTYIKRPLTAGSGCNALWTGFLRRLP